MDMNLLYRQLHFQRLMHYRHPFSFPGMAFEKLSALCHINLPLENRSRDRALLSQIATRTCWFILRRLDYHAQMLLTFSLRRRKSVEGVTWSDHLVSVSRIPIFLEVIMYWFMGPKGNKRHDCATRKQQNQKE